MVVGDGERPASAGEHGLEHLGGLDRDLIDATVSQQHDLDRPGRPVSDHDDESLAVTVEEFWFDDPSDGVVVDEPGPSRGRAGPPPDLDDRDEFAGGSRPDAR
jgi:hypothetical protein